MNCKHLSANSINSKYIVEASLGSCSSCQAKGIDLWICLDDSCLYVGCGNKWNDHISQHYNRTEHLVFMNLSTFTVECIACEKEVLMIDKLKKSKLKSIQSRLQAKRKRGINILNSAGTDNPDDNSTFKSLQPLANCDRLCGIVGLSNLGNTCYMNAALQCLSNCSQLTNYLMSEISLDNTSGHLASEYAKLTSRLWQDSSRFHAPNTFQNAFVKQNLAFRGYHQQDAHEFIRCLFTSLQNETKYEVPQLQNSCKSDDAGGDACGDSVVQQKQCGSHEVSCSDKMDVDEDFKDAMNDLTEPLLKQKVNIYPESPLKEQTKEYKTPKFQVAEKSMISDIFEGTITSTVECTTCNNCSSTQEPFQDLSIPIPDMNEIMNLQNDDNDDDYDKIMLDLDAEDKYSQMTYSEWIWSYWDSMKSTISNWVWPSDVTLEDCLASFFSADQLTGDNMYSCEKCKKLRNGVKQCRITRLPEVLCIHLKRFRHEGYNSYPTKISCPVKYPLERLDLSAYMSASADCESLYDLFAIVVHRGGSGAGGHYISYAKNPIDSNWYEFDDTYVTHTDEMSVAHAEAYVLFYKKRESTETVEVREEMLKVDVQQKTHLISSEWMYKLFNFSHPGPIDNRNLLCHHGEIEPDIADDLDHRACQVSDRVYDYLHEKFGGYAGSKITEVGGCPECKRLIEMRESKRSNEYLKFQQLQDIENPAAQPTCYISIKWFRVWQMFILDKQLEPPDCEINNKEFAVERNGKYFFDKYSHYFEISVDAWNYLVSKYGGGPFLPGKNCPETPQKTNLKPEQPETAAVLEDDEPQKQNKEDSPQQIQNNKQETTEPCENCSVENNGCSVVQTLDSNNTEISDEEKTQISDEEKTQISDEEKIQTSEDENTQKDVLNQQIKTEDNSNLLNSEEPLKIPLPV